MYLQLESQTYVNVVYLPRVLESAAAALCLPHVHLCGMVARSPVCTCGFAYISEFCEGGGLPRARRGAGLGGGGGQALCLAAACVVFPLQSGYVMHAYCVIKPTHR